MKLKTLLTVLALALLIASPLMAQEPADTTEPDSTMPLQQDPVDPTDPAADLDADNDGDTTNDVSGDLEVEAVENDFVTDDDQDLPAGVDVDADGDVDADADTDTMDADTRDDTTDDELPRTAGPLGLLALLGLAGAGSAFGLRRLRK